MKLEELKKRLDKQRPMTTISMRFPVDVLDDLKRVAPLRGFSGYQPLIRAYVGQGLRVDLERLEPDPVTALVESLKRHGVSEEVLQEALAEMGQRYEWLGNVTSASTDLDEGVGSLSQSQAGPNKGVQPTAYSVRSSVASASSGG